MYRAFLHTIIRSLVISTPTQGDCKEKGLFIPTILLYLSSEEISIRKDKKQKRKIRIRGQIGLI